jgi:hypothetical protein
VVAVELVIVDPAIPAKLLLLVVQAAVVLVLLMAVLHLLMQRLELQI